MTKPTAVQQVVDAWTKPGVNPPRRDWPVLARAIERLVEENR